MFLLCWLCVYFICLVLVSHQTDIRLLHDICDVLSSSPTWAASPERSPGSHKTTFFFSSVDALVVLRASLNLYNWLLLQVFYPQVTLLLRPLRKQLKSSRNWSFLQLIKKSLLVLPQLILFQCVVFARFSGFCSEVSLLWLPVIQGCPNFFQRGTGLMMWCPRANGPSWHFFNHKRSKFCHV